MARSLTLLPAAGVAGATGAADDARQADRPPTSREVEVAGLVAEGLTNREIAGQLYISIRTVTSHLDHIYTKPGLSSRDALADWYRSAHA